jgi:hypothetical protein
MDLTKDIFKRLLVPMWLRPERALWEAHQLNVVRGLLGEDFMQPSLEYGCTDGILSYVMLGGSLGLPFDDYGEVSCDRDAYTQHSLLGSDYFDRFEKDLDLSQAVKTRPAQHFTCGISWKETHIQKSERLGFYEQLFCRSFDASLDDLPAKHFKTIFGANLFWLDDGQLDRAVRELRRKVHPQGRMITIFPNEHQPAALFYAHAKAVDPKWADDLDRGIHINLTRHAQGSAEWQAFFQERGWSISRQETFIPSVVSEVYQIGLRPMFPVFVNMYQRLAKETPEGLLDLKAHWIETAYHFLSPLCDTAWMDHAGMPRLWHALELRPV